MQGVGRLLVLIDNHALTTLCDRPHHPSPGRRRTSLIHSPTLHQARGITVCVASSQR